eukprot:1869275-Rhodomonas_salina.1
MSVPATALRLLRENPCQVSDAGQRMRRDNYRTWHSGCVGKTIPVPDTAPHVSTLDVVAGETEAPVVVGVLPPYRVHNRDVLVHNRRRSLQLEAVKPWSVRDISRNACSGAEEAATSPPSCFISSSWIEACPRGSTNLRRQ